MKSLFAKLAFCLASLLASAAPSAQTTNYLVYLSYESGAMNSASLSVYVAVMASCPTSASWTTYFGMDNQGSTPRPTDPYGASASVPTPMVYQFYNSGMNWASPSTSSGYVCVAGVPSKVVLKPANGNTNTAITLNLGDAWKLLPNSSQTGFNTSSVYTAFTGIILPDGKALASMSMATYGCCTYFYGNSYPMYSVMIFRGIFPGSVLAANTIRCNGYGGYGFRPDGDTCGIPSWTSFGSPTLNWIFGY